MPKPTPNRIDKNATKSNMIKYIRNLLRYKKNNVMKDKTIKDIRTLLESDNEDYNQPVRTINAFDCNFIEYESEGGKNKTLSIDDYLKEFKPCLINMINDIKALGEWKIQLSIAINFISSKNTNEKLAIHLKSNNIEIMIGNKIG